MGVDFIERTAPAFRKAVSRDAETVARMSCGVSSAGHRRVVVADITGEVAKVAGGETLVVRAVGGKLLLIEGLHEVGCVQSPPPDVLSKIEDLGGFTDGTVEHVNSLGGTFDVALP
jgi:hypothetical protein